MAISLNEYDFKFDVDTNINGNSYRLKDKIKSEVEDSNLKIAFNNVQFCT